MTARIRDGYVAVRGVLSARPSLDWLAVVVLIGIHLLLWWRADVPGLSELGKDDRMRMFTTVATVASLLFGFATASIAFFYGSADGERVNMMKRVLSDQLLAAWRAALSAPLVAIGVTVLALALDTAAGGRPVVGWAVEAALLLLGVRAVRLRWLFLSTLTLLALDKANPQVAAGGTTPTRAVAEPRKRQNVG